MFSLYRSTPKRDIKDLYSLYGTEHHDQIPFLRNLDETTASLKSIIRKRQFREQGIVLSVEGTWGSGKTTFVELLCQALEPEDVAIVKYESLYYGNVSEATDIFIKDIFDEVQEKFGIKLGDGSSIAKNITPTFELSNGLPKFTLGYKSSRAPTEVIKKKLESKLERLRGKMVVIIDDIDRVPAKDVVHFLRIVRVLRELPNFIIILPIDRLVVEELLQSQSIINPKGYLQKIIDDSVDINPEQGTSKDLFHKLLKDRYETDVPTEMCDLVWDLYLWEISLAVVKPYEVEGQQRLRLGTGPNEDTWKMVDQVNSASNDNIVKEFFKLTSAAYGSGVNFVMRVNDHYNTGSNFKDIYKHYSNLFPNTTFTELMSGRYIDNLDPNIEDFNNGRTMMDFRWWNDRDSIMPRLPGAQQTGEYRLDIPADGPERDQHFTDLNSQAHYLWDTTRHLAGSFLPQIAVQYLAPRTMNKVINNLEVDISQYVATARAEDNAPLQRAMRKTVQESIVLNVTKAR
jgi:hypothetical protein